MKQTSSHYYGLLLVVLSVQLIINLVLPISANAQSYQFTKRGQRPLVAITIQDPVLSEDNVTESNPETAPETNPGPPEPPESFPENPVETSPGQDEASDETESSQESEPSEESSSSAEPLEESERPSSDASDGASTENDFSAPGDETKIILPVNQIAPGSLMIKPSNLLEPINIGSTVKQLVSTHYDAAVLSLHSGILIAHYLFIPAGKAFVPYFGTYLVGYFENLLKIVI